MELPKIHRAKTVQEYIDEQPQWADGTPLPFSPLTAMQWRIWSLAAAGKFFEGLVVFMTGVAIPLIGAEFGLAAYEHGLVASASLAGILFGALVLGGLADTFGRKPLFVAEMAIFIAFLIFTALSPNFTCLVIALFGVGLALGCDYPTSHLVISESMPSSVRGRLVLSAFGFQAVGALTGTVIGYLILANLPQLDAWRFMYAAAIIPALIVLIGRFFVTESAPWLATRGRLHEATRETRRLLTRDPLYPHEITLAVPEPNAATAHRRTGYMSLFGRKCRRATILASVPWFLQDLSTYGIGIFTPILLAASFGHVSEHAHNLSALIHIDIRAAKGAAVIDVLLIVGFIAAALLADKIGRIKLQIFGFIGCAAALALAAIAMTLSSTAHIALLFAALMLFNFMTNVGPNAQTYLIAGEVFPTAIRGKGAGAAAALAKLGAVSVSFLFPILLVDLGAATLLAILAATSLAGAVITWAFRIETAGISLDKIG